MDKQAEIYANYKAQNKATDARKWEIFEASKCAKVNKTGAKVFEYQDVFGLDVQVDGCYKLADGRICVTYVRHGWLFESYVMDAATYSELKGLKTSMPLNAYFE